MTLKHVFLPKRGHMAHLVHRDNMKPLGLRKAHAAKAVPATTLPVDSTGNATVQAGMDGNDQYGDCGPVMCEHVYNILTYGQGQPGFTEVQDNVNALIQQYLQVSGGDNGTDENMLVGPNGIWRSGLAGNVHNVIVDALDIDYSDAALVQYCIDQFYAVCLGWSVPDDFLQNFDTGTVWASADTPDPANGHYTPLADIGGATTVSGNTNLNGFYRLWTWGTWCWVSPAFVNSVQPQGFVAFSPAQFNAKTGLDSKGRHITVQAAKWQAIGGNAIPPAIINSFPPATPTPPSPPPAPPPSPPPSPPSPPPAPPPAPPPSPPPSPTPPPLPFPIAVLEQLADELLADILADMQADAANNAFLSLGLWALRQRPALRASAIKRAAAIVQKAAK